MYQENLWSAPARTTGFTIVYDDRTTGEGAAGRLAVSPKWAKRPADTGFWVADFDGEDDVWNVPAVLHAVFSGWSTTCPQRTLPRDLGRVLKDARDNHQAYHLA